MDLHDYRQQYEQAILAREELDADPFRQFTLMFSKAQDKGIAEPNAMTLATYDEVHGVTARVVLLKELDHEGFVFFTNYNSLKGKQLNYFPEAALMFWWQSLECQIRIKGDVHKIEDERSNRYFDSRPRDSRAASIVSKQSENIIDYKALLLEFEKLRQSEESQLQRPAHWGGYCLVPSEFEFWQGRPNRMHDRFRYTKKDTSWQIDQLFP